MAEIQATSIEQLADVVVVHVLVHDLDEANITRMRSDLAAAAGATPMLPFILDLAKVKFVPSLTLGVLVRVASEFRTRSQRLVFVGLQPTVRKAITITRIDRLLELADDVAAAKRSLGIVG